MKMSLHQLGDHNKVIAWTNKNLQDPRNFAGSKVDGHLWKPLRLSGILLTDTIVNSFAVVGCGIAAPVKLAARACASKFHKTKIVSALDKPELLKASVIGKLAVRVLAVAALLLLNLTLGFIHLRSVIRIAEKLTLVPKQTYAQIEKQTSVLQKQTLEKAKEEKQAIDQKAEDQKAKVETKTEEEFNKLAEGEVKVEKDKLTEDLTKHLVPDLVDQLLPPPTTPTPTLETTPTAGEQPDAVHSAPRTPLNQSSDSTSSSESEAADANPAEKKDATGLPGEVVIQIEHAPYV